MTSENCCDIQNSVVTNIKKKEKEFVATLQNSIATYSSKANNTRFRIYVVTIEKLCRGIN